MESLNAKNYIDRLAPITDRSKIYARIIAVKAVEIAEEELKKQENESDRQNRHSRSDESSE